MPKVSIIVPCYNVERYLDRCVKSLVNQTLTDIEIILVDDESPDNVPLMCDEYAREDNRIKVIHKKNAGLGMACNSGLEVATGEYVAFCDSDDWVDPDMYQTLYNMALKEHASMVFSGIRRVDEYGNSFVMLVAEKYKVWSGTDSIETFALDMVATDPEVKKERNTAMSAKVVLYNRAMLLNYNIRFESERNMISEDLLFNLDCLVHSDIVVECPKVFYNYFVNSSSLTGVIRKDRCDKYIVLREELLSRYCFSNPKFKERVNRMFIGYVRDEIARISTTKNETFANKRAVISRIAQFQIWKNIFKDYPVHKMPLTHRLHFIALRFKLVNLLIASSFLR